MVLYRKYRPGVFAEVIGQNHVREPLLAQLSSGKISHAYLFSGPRGTGKTSVARILAKAVNCQSQIANLPVRQAGRKSFDDKQQATSDMRFGEPCGTCESCQSVSAGTHLDLIEIDAASNRGIDEIRDLREKIKLSPASGRFKVYIIDEAHMLTPEAFNALLKTLEEPPEHAIFVLATTEPQKIPATIISRTSRFDFKVPSVSQIKEKLSVIAKAEGWSFEEAVLEEIAKRAAGAFRDAEVLLEKVASVNTASTLEKTREIIGKKESTDLVSLLELLEKGEVREALIWLNEYLVGGGSVRILTESVLEVLRKIIIIKAGAANLLEPIAQEELAALQSLATKITKPRLLELTSLFNKAIEDLREATIPQLPLELAVVEATLDRGTEETKVTKEAKETEGAKVTDEAKETEGTKEIKATEETKIKKETTETEEMQKAEIAEESKETKWAEETKPARNASLSKAGGETKETQETESIKATKVTGAQEEKLLKKLQKDWGEFLKNLKPLNSSIALFLKDAKPVDLDEDLLTVEFGYRFHKAKIEERKYRELVEEVLARVAGKPLRIKGVVSAKPPEKKPEASKPKQEEKEDVDPVEIFSKLD